MCAKQNVGRIPAQKSFVYCIEPREVVHPRVASKNVRGLMVVGKSHCRIPSEFAELLRTQAFELAISGGSGGLQGEEALLYFVDSFVTRACVKTLIVS